MGSRRRLIPVSAFTRVRTSRNRVVSPVASAAPARAGRATASQSIVLAPAPDDPKESADGRRQGVASSRSCSEIAAFSSATAAIFWVVVSTVEMAELI